MGIGYPLDIVLCSAMGADMFDSVYPTRTARFGVALVGSGTLKLRHAAFAEDFRCARGFRPVESASCRARSRLHAVPVACVSKDSISGNKVM